MTFGPMLVIVPSRGRPENVARLERAREEYTHLQDTDFMYVVDADDPALQGYLDLDLSRIVIQQQRRRLGPALNMAARKAAHEGHYDVIGFMGDDHLPQTYDWDARIRHAADSPEPRVVYGNDLLQGAALPTAVFMHARIIAALGYMCPPDQVHLYLDNFWKELGERLGGLVYLDDVVIEHIHPAAGKTPMDDRYREVNAPEVDSADRTAWLAYRDAAFPDALARVRQAYAAEAGR